MRGLVLGAMVLLGGCVDRLAGDADDVGEGGQDAGETAGDEAPEDDDDASASASASGAGEDLPAACDVDSHESDCDGDGLPDGDDPQPEDPSGPARARADVIYLHSGGGLYTFDPATLVIDRIATFTIDGGFGEILDIAIDRFGVMYAVNFGGLFVCDPSTAACTTLASVSSNSLGIVPAGVVDDDDVLVALAGNTLTQIHLQGPEATVIEVGDVPSPYSSSGDVATLVDGTIVFTSPSSSGTDVVVMVDPSSAVVLGELGPVTGSFNTWGLATFGGALWAADAQGSIWRQDGRDWSWITRFVDQGWGAAAHPDAAH